MCSVRNVTRQPNREKIMISNNFTDQCFFSFLSFPLNFIYSSIVIEASLNFSVAFSSWLHGSGIQMDFLIVNCGGSEELFDDFYRMPGIQKLWPTWSYVVFILVNHLPSLSGELITYSWFCFYLSLEGLNYYNLQLTWPQLSITFLHMRQRDLWYCWLSLVTCCVLDLTLLVVSEAFLYKTHYSISFNPLYPTHLYSFCCMLIVTILSVKLCHQLAGKIFWLFLKKLSLNPELICETCSMSWDYQLHLQLECILLTSPCKTWIKRCLLLYVKYCHWLVYWVQW